MRHGIIGHILCCAAALPAHAACTVAATPVAFGVYQSSAQLPTDSTGTVTVACGIFTSYSVSISAGVGGTNALNRALSSGGNRLAYNLYTDPTRIRHGSSSGAMARPAPCVSPRLRLAQR